MQEKSKIDYVYMRYPRALFRNSYLKSVSIETRTLFAMLYDRLELSEINSERFTDENGEIYVIYTIEELCEDLTCSKTKVNRMFNELTDKGLITRKRKTHSSPYRIYISSTVCDLIKCEVKKSDVIKCDVARAQNDTSREHKIRPRESTECAPIKNNNNNNNIINNNSSIIVTDDEIKEQIEFEYIYCEKNAAMVDEIIMIISDIYNGRTPTVKIGKEELPRELVISRFRRLDGTHISNIIWHLERNKTKIRNMKSYLITLLYDEVTTSDCAVVADFAMHYGID